MDTNNFDRKAFEDRPMPDPRRIIVEDPYIPGDDEDLSCGDDGRVHGNVWGV